jgi:hypothetical protein
MKISKLLVLLCVLFCGASANAQSPQSINYQAVVRDANGVVVMNRVVTFRLSILTGGSTGVAQYVETHNATTNTFGLVTLNIGLGTPTTGSMSNVTWATGSKFLRVEVDINGGTNYTALGTTQFLSVPYALYAATSGSPNSTWSLTGNAPTTGNYIGTTNLEDLRFNTAGTQKMVLKTSGYVGIGTNVPDFKMVIENDAESTAGIDDGRTLLQLHNKSFASYATTNLRIKTGNTSNVTMISHYGPTYTQYPNFADYGLMLSTGPGLMMQAPAGNIRFMTGPAPNNVGIYDRMVITNDGNVGIGTTSPSARFHNIGTARFEGLSTNNSGSRLLVADASGNLALRDVSTLPSGGGTGSGWGLSGNTTTTSNYIGTNNSDDVRINTEGTQKMVVKTTGNVGIGTNTPDFKMVIENPDGNTAGIDDGRTLLQLHNKSSLYYATTNLRIKTGNTSNVTMLAHYGPTYTQYPTFADYGLMLSTGPGLMMQAPAGDIRFMTGPAPNNVGIYDRMVITNSGNVGIGTKTPSHKLRVEANSDNGADIDRIQLQLHNTSNSSSAFGGLGISSGTSGTNTWLEHIGANYSVYSSTYPDFNDMTYFLSTGSNGMYLLSGSDGPNTKIRFAVGSSNNVPATRMTLNKTGLGLGTETPKAKIEVANGDVYVSDPTKGIILKSPNGSCWRVTMDNTGNFVRTAITCPN